MVREQVLECAFLVPIFRDEDLSDGDLHPTSAWDWLTGELYEHFQGLTIAPGFYLGIYRDPDAQRRVDDQSRKYIVAVPEDQIDQLRVLLTQACRVFHQKCIYLSVAGKVEFVEAADEPF